VALQEIAAVGLGGLAQRRDAAVARLGLGRGERPLEGGDVQPEGRVRAPPQRPLGHLEEAVGVREGAAEIVEHVTQVRPRLPLGRVGPQQERQPLPRLRRVPVQQEVGEQRLRPRRLQWRRPGLALPQVELAEQADAQRGCPDRDAPPSA
jgi:hypothetical protein